MAGCSLHWEFGTECVVARGLSLKFFSDPISISPLLFFAKTLGRLWGSVIKNAQALLCLGLVFGNRVTALCWSGTENALFSPQLAPRKLSLVLETFSLSCAAELLTIARRMQADHTF